MRALLTSFFILVCSSTFAATTPFDQFLGEYSVVSTDCKSTSSYLEELEKIKITKGTSFGRNPEDTFIHFKRGSYYSEFLNLSAFYRVTDYTITSGAILNIHDNRMYQMERLSEEKISFNFLSVFGKDTDECSYVLEINL